MWIIKVMCPDGNIVKISCICIEVAKQMLTDLRKEKDCDGFIFKGEMR